MIVDLSLILITLAVAVGGTLWKEPPPSAKIFLIALAVLASTASFKKSIDDNADKEFMQKAIISTLIPSDSEYQKFYDAIVAVSASLGLGDDYRCYHTQDGLSCFIDNATNKKRSVIVLNRSEVAELYANLLRGEGANEKVAELFGRSYDPSAQDEEFLDKVGILGMHLVERAYQQSAKDYDYDDSYGTKLSFEKDGQVVNVLISSDDLRKIAPDKAPAVFQNVAKLYLDKFPAK
jgi:hypothetical protein